MEQHEAEAAQQTMQMQAAWYFQQMQEGNITADQLQALTGMEAEQLHLQILALAQAQQQAAQAAVPEQPAPGGNEKTKLCKYFMEGTCQKGANCKFYHPPAGEVQIGPAGQPGTAADGVGLANRLPVKTKICKYFALAGKCHRGDNCTFLHTAGEPGVMAPQDDWMCPCGFANRARNLICGGHGGRKGCKAAKPTSGVRSVPADKRIRLEVGWSCSCGFENRAENTICGSTRGTYGCKKPRPNVAAVLPNEDSFMFLPSKCQNEDEVMRKILESVHAQRALAEQVAQQVAVAMPAPVPVAEVPAEGPLTKKQKREQENRRKPCAIYMISPAMCQDEAQCGFSHDAAVVAAAREEKNVAPEPSFVPCKLYLEGCCTKGADCAFFHDPALAGDAPGQSQASNDEPKVTQKEVCKLFLEGCCNKGDSCAFSHDDPRLMEEAAAASRSTGSDAAAAAPPPDSPPARPPLPKKVPKGVCKFFLQNGVCTKGDTCEFAHNTNLNKNGTNIVNGRADDYSFEWICACGFNNMARNMVCGGKGNMGCKAARPPPNSNPEPFGDWTCSLCDFRNSVINEVCGGLGQFGCKAPKPGTKEHSMALLVQANQLDQYQAELLQAQMLAQAVQAEQLAKAAQPATQAEEQKTQEGQNLSKEVLQYLQLLPPEQLQAYLEKLSPEQLQLLQELAPDQFEELVSKWKANGGASQLLEEDGDEGSPPKDKDGKDGKGKDGKDGKDAKGKGKDGKSKDGKGKPKRRVDLSGGFWICSMCGTANSSDDMVCGGSSGSGCQAPRQINPAASRGKSAGEAKGGKGGMDAMMNGGGDMMMDMAAMPPMMQDMLMMMNGAGGKGCGDMMKGGKGKGDKKGGKGKKSKKGDKGGGELQGPWTCSVCNFTNVGSNKICGGVGDVGCNAPRDRTNWVCISCGFANKAESVTCGGGGLLGCKKPPQPGQAPLAEQAMAMMEMGVPLSAEFT